MGWYRPLAHITGSVDDELLLRNEYLVKENRILRSKLGKRVKLTDSERIGLAEIGKRLGRRALEEVATIVKPDTILGWHRRLIAKKFDGSKNRGPGRPRVPVDVERLVVQIATENRGWGTNRIVGALANLGHAICDETVANILRRSGITPAPERRSRTTWKEFIQSHMDVLHATPSFTFIGFTTEVWTRGGLVTPAPSSLTMFSSSSTSSPGPCELRASLQTPMPSS